jgi:hypothetical protein
MANMVKIMNTTREKFTVDQVIRAIRNGELPDGTIRDDEAYLKALGTALASLSPDELEEVMKATGCDVAAADAIADELLSNLPVPAPPECTETPTCVRATGDNDFLRGFSLAHEVIHNAAVVAVEAVRRGYGTVMWGTGMWFGGERSSKTKAYEITEFGISGGGKPPIDLGDGRRSTAGLNCRIDVPMLPFIRRERHIDGE